MGRVRSLDERVLLDKRLTRTSTLYSQLKVRSKVPKVISISIHLLACVQHLAAHVEVQYQ